MKPRASCVFSFYPLSPFFLHTCSVNPFSPSTSCHLFICEWVQQVSIEGGGSNDDPASRQINPWRQCGGSSQDSDHALTKGSFQHISLVKRQTLRDKPSVNALWFFWTAVLKPQVALRPSTAWFFSMAILTRGWSRGEYPDWIALSTIVATCQLQCCRALKHTMFYWKRLKSGNWYHKPIWKRFNKVINQVWSRVIFSYAYIQSTDFFLKPVDPPFERIQVSLFRFVSSVQIFVQSARRPFFLL